MKKFVLTISSKDGEDKFTAISEYMEDENIIPTIERQLKIYNNRDRLHKHT